MNLAHSIWIALLSALVLLPSAENVTPRCMGKRPLLLTAHPDDECMFFAPTILALQEAPLLHPPKLHSLCLSVGNADGLGDIRRRELEGSLEVLGIGEGRRWVIDTP